MIGVSKKIVAAWESNQDLLPTVHPGEVLREEFLTPLRITAYQLAKSIGVPQTRISQILNEKRKITADTALRFGQFFDTTPQFWMNLQGLYDLEEAERAFRDAYSGIEPVHAERIYDDAVSDAVAGEASGVVNDGGGSDTVTATSKSVHQ